MNMKGIAFKTMTHAAVRNPPRHNEQPKESHNPAVTNETTVKIAPKLSRAFCTKARLARSLGLSADAIGEKNQPGSWFHKPPTVITSNTTPIAAANSATMRY